MLLSTLGVLLLLTVASGCFIMDSSSSSDRTEEQSLEPDEEQSLEPPTPLSDDQIVTLVESHFVEENERRVTDPITVTVSEHVIHLRQPLRDHLHGNESKPSGFAFSKLRELCLAFPELIGNVKFLDLTYVGQTKETTGVANAEEIPDCQP